MIASGIETAFPFYFSPLKDLCLELPAFFGPALYRFRVATLIINKPWVRFFFFWIPFRQINMSEFLVTFLACLLFSVPESGIRQQCFKLTAMMITHDEKRRSDLPRGVPHWVIWSNCRDPHTPINWSSTGLWGFFSRLWRRSYFSPRLRIYSKLRRVPPSKQSHSGTKSKYSLGFLQGKGDTVSIPPCKVFATVEVSITMETAVTVCKHSRAACTAQASFVKNSWHCHGRLLLVCKCRHAQTVLVNDWLSTWKTPERFSVFEWNSTGANLATIRTGARFHSRNLFLPVCPPHSAEESWKSIETTGTDDKLCATVHESLLDCGKVMCACVVISTHVFRGIGACFFFLDRQGEDVSRCDISLGRRIDASQLDSPSRKSGF